MSSVHTAIKILPEHIIDQIKAGEVLERPAALLKELLENSIDAQASEIHIHLIENGLELLSIEDNGHGMDFKNLPYAFIRHATSKLESFEDIYRLRSFGFRGEALASVAASSRLTCVSQPKDLSLQGGKIIISGGVEELLIPQQSSSAGTSLYIKDLFYNTPARLKFIKSKLSEKSALKKMLASFIIAHHEIAFHIRWDDKDKEVFKAYPQDKLARIGQLFFNKTQELESLLQFSSEEYTDYRVEIYYTRETYSTPQYRHHYIFVNDRYFQDKSIHQTLLRNLEGLWSHGLSGHYAIFITAPTDEIDVNVHPNKTQIKFFKSDIIYTLIVNALRKTFKKSTPSSNSEISNHPQTFFSADDLNSMSLDSFSANHQNLGNHEPLSLHNQLTGFTSTDFFKLLDNFIITQNNNCTLIKVSSLLSRYYTDRLSHFYLEEMNPEPLLISEPFTVKNSIDQYFSLLKKLGFEFDRLSEQLIVLRTSPAFVHSNLLSPFTHELISYIIAFKGNMDFDKFYSFLSEKSEKNKTFENIHDFELSKILESSLSSRDHELNLTPDILNSLFKKNSHE